MSGNMKWTSIAFTISALVLSGCANNPGVKNSEKLTMENIESTVAERAAELDDTWSKTDPAISYFDREQSLYIERANVIPERLLSKKVRGLTIRPGGTLGRLQGVFYPYKLNVLFSGASQAAPVESKPGDAPTQATGDLEKLPFSIRNYNGTIGELLMMIERLHNISFEYIGGNSIKVAKTSTFIASMPQNDEVLKALDEGVKSLGATNVSTNRLAGSLIYEASNHDQEMIRDYMDRFYENFAGVKMQMTVFSVSLNQSLSDGFNWRELDVVLGNVEAAYSGGVIEQLIGGLTDGQNSQNGTTGGTTGTNNNSGSNSGNSNSNSNSGSSNGPDFGYDSRYAGSSINDMKGFSWFKPEGIEMGAFNKNISLSVVMDWLNQYGSTRAEQSAFLETVTGKETEIKSQKKIPYVESESTSFVGTQQPIASSSTETKEEEVGIKVVFKPFYESSSQEIVLDLKVELKNLVGYTTLTTQSGDIQRPEIQEQLFPTTVRMKAGETKLLGGVIFDTLVEARDDVSLVKFDDGEYINQKLSKSAMFVLIRPTVQLFRQKSKGE